VLVRSVESGGIRPPVPVGTLAFKVVDPLISGDGIVNLVGLPGGWDVMAAHAEVLVELTDDYLIDLLVACDRIDLLRDRAATGDWSSNQRLATLATERGDIDGTVNLPLAAVLWNGGISFGGVIAFIYSDLLILPILNIYRKYYGVRMALVLLAVFSAAMVAAGYFGTTPPGSISPSLSWRLCLSPASFAPAESRCYA
jgi:uncharacterized membrane protein YraQ (UPF0718 family)